MPHPAPGSAVRIFQTNSVTHWGPVSRVPATVLKLTTLLPKGSRPHLQPPSLPCLVLLQRLLLSPPGNVPSGLLSPSSSFLLSASPPPPTSFFDICMQEIPGVTLPLSRAPTHAFVIRYLLDAARLVAGTCPSAQGCPGAPSPPLGESHGSREETWASCWGRALPSTPHPFHQQSRRSQPEMCFTFVHVLKLWLTAPLGPHLSLHHL